MSLAEEQCTPPKAGDAPLARKEAQELARETPEWTLEEQALAREFKFRDFMEAVDFVNQAAAVAQDQDHHPDILISYNRVRLTLSTHKIGGLSRNDFIVAAKIDRMIQSAKGNRS